MCGEVAGSGNAGFRDRPRNTSSPVGRRPARPAGLDLPAPPHQSALLPDKPGVPIRGRHSPTSRKNPTPLTAGNSTTAEVPVSSTVVSFCQDASGPGTELLCTR